MRSRLGRRLALATVLEVIFGAGGGGGGAPAGRNVGGGDFSTDFDEYDTGFVEAEDDFTLQWSTVQQWTFADAGGGDIQMDKSASGSSFHAVVWEPPGELANLEVLIQVVLESDTIGPKIIMHVSEDTGTSQNDGIEAGLNLDTERIGTIVNGSFTSRATRDREFSSGETWFIRARVVDDVIGMKAWEENDSEPETWLEYDAAALGSPITDAGKMGVHMFGSTGCRILTMDVWSDD